MKQILRFVLILFGVLLSTLAYTQRQNPFDNDPGNENEKENTTEQNDSLSNIGNLKNVKTRYFNSKYIGFYNKAVVDTILHNVEFYNPGKQPLFFSQDLGIIGSANMPLSLQFNPQSSFDIGIHTYDLYLRKLSDVQIVETPSPFTQLSYVMGSKKENVLQVKHAQSFLNEQIRAGIDFKLYNNIGYYTRQQTDVKNFDGNLSYQTKNKRYSVEGIYFHNKLVLQENGGIIYDSLYQQNLEENRTIISVNLANAENYIKHSGFAVEQTFYLALPEPDFSNIPDTNTIDFTGYSVQHYKKPYFDHIPPLGQLKHRFVYTKEIYQYSDTDGGSDFYAAIPNFPTDSTQVFDSIAHRKIETSVLYSNADYKDNSENPKHLFYSFGVGIASHRYSQDTLAHTLTELQPQGRLQLFYTKNFYLLASGMYSYRSDNTSAYDLSGKLNLSIKNIHFLFQAHSSSTQAGWIFQEFYSSYFQWNNNFRNQKLQELSAKLTFKNTHLTAETGIMHDYLYFNENVIPTQYATPLSFLKVSFNQLIHLGNFGIDINFIYQKTSEDNILRVPKFLSNTKLYYSNTLFKGALDLELGVNVRYFSSYYANAYMPALRSFYLQNETTIGNYPYLDVFVSGKIKRARLFLKYSQLNAGFMPENYFASPHYPNPNASLKFGVTWQLFN